MRLERSRVQLPAEPLSGNDLGQVVYTHVPLSPSSTSDGAAMPCDWEGNRSSGVALAMRHRLEWFIHLRAQSLSKGGEHPTNTLHGVWYSLPLDAWQHLEQPAFIVVCEMDATVRCRLSYGVCRLRWAHSSRMYLPAVYWTPERLSQPCLCLIYCAFQ